MSGPDFLTGCLPAAAGGRIRWRRDLARVLDNGIDGLRVVTVNYASNANNANHSLAPALLPGGSAMVAA